MEVPVVDPVVVEVPVVQPVVDVVVTEFPEEPELDLDDVCCWQLVTRLPNANMSKREVNGLFPFMVPILLVRLYCQFIGVF